jgi:hypothetical protein
MINEVCHKSLLEARYCYYFWADRIFFPISDDGPAEKKLTHARWLPDKPVRFMQMRFPYFIIIIVSREEREKKKITTKSNM